MKTRSRGVRDWQIEKPNQLDFGIKVIEVYGWWDECEGYERGLLLRSEKTASPSILAGVR